MNLTLCKFQGFFGAHLRLWMQYFSAKQIVVVKSENYFAAAGLIEEKVLRFLQEEMATSADVQGRLRGSLFQRRQLLGRSSIAPAESKTCWHNCETKKRSYEEDVDEALELRLQVLYKSDSKLLEDTRKYVQWIE